MTEPHEKAVEIVRQSLLPTYDSDYSSSIAKDILFALIAAGYPSLAGPPETER